MRDRVLAKAKGDRDCRGRSFGRPRSRIANRSDNGDATADKVGHERRQAIVFSVQPMVLHRYVLALYVARFAEALTKRGCMTCGTIKRSAADKADHQSRRLLRARRKRPRDSRAADQRDELAAFHARAHSITSSARSKIPVGSSTPIALAVLRLTTNSNFVACSTGRSVGFAPLRIFATYSAARRYIPEKSAPYVMSPPTSAQCLAMNMEGRWCAFAASTMRALYGRKKGLDRTRSICASPDAAPRIAASKS